MQQLKLGNMAVDVHFKNIKNVHLSVHPPLGRVRVSAPTRMSLDTIRLFTISKLSWIKLQQRKLQKQERETPREYLERESHYLWGKRYLLAVRKTDDSPSVELKHSRMLLHIGPKTDQAKRQEILEHWYREQLKLKAPPLIAKWEKLMHVRVKKFYVQRMKTKWGSCNPSIGSIRLNTELAKKPRECLEYIVVHEMLHLLEPTHNERFIKLMDKFMPKWRFYREGLNRLPVRHESWEY